MMEQKRNHLSKILWRLLLVAAIAILLCGSAFAMEGTGTEAAPYVITTAEDLAVVHADLDGHYVLGNDIDLAGYDYTPIGNEAEGAFTGSFDGKGFTISNLTVKEATKYVGLFGYLEGSVKNVTLSAVNVDGARYVGAAVGYAASGAIIADCSVLSGTVSCQDTLMTPYIGGILGYCDGTIVGEFHNYANVVVETSASSCVGGIVGFVKLSMELSNCSNRGNISVYSNTLNVLTYSGGLIGYANASLVLTSCSNSGKISNSSTWNTYSGGLLGYTSDSIILANCSNSGAISSRANSNAYAGGLVGYNGATGTLTSCFNSGSIIATAPEYKDSSYAAGFIGKGKSIKLSQCINNGFVTADGWFPSANPFGYSGSSLTIESTCINRGDITEISSDGIKDPVRYRNNNLRNVSHSFILANDDKEESGILLDENGVMLYTALMDNSYVYNYEYGFYCADIKNKRDISSAVVPKTLAELQNPEVYADWHWGDCEGSWLIDPKKNSGLPFPEDMRMDIFNESVLFLTPGHTARLEAEFDVENWAITDSSIVSCENGVVKALKPGTAGVSAHAVNNQHRANCIIFVYQPQEQMSVSAAATALNKGETTQISTDLYDAYPDDPQGLIWSSSDPSIATVNASGKVTAVGGGEVTITGYAPLSDISASCTITVTAPITSLSVPSSVTINAGTPAKLSYTVSPNPFTGILSWKSTDETIVTAEDGILTGHAPGMAIVTATSDTGIERSCTVTVVQPSSSIQLSETEVTLEGGFTHELVASLIPENSTDTITWNSSNTSVATVANGVLTAKRAGQTLITATTTSGQKAYCTVTVVNATTLPSSISLNQQSWRAKIGEKMQLTATVLPTNATDRSVKWSSSVPEVAEVSSTGVVTAVGSGKAVITATTHNGFFAECEVKVAVTSSAAFELGDGRATVGKTVDIPVYIHRNPGIAAFTVTLDYDKAAMTPVAVTAGDLLSVGTFETNLSDENRSQLHLTWYDAENLTEDGLAFTVTMQMADTVSAGTYNVGLSYEADDICDADKSSVAFAVEPAQIKLVDYLIGDIYVDGKVGMKDIVLLCRYINDLEDLSGDQLLAADVYYDGNVDVKDLVELAQILMNQTPVAVQTFGLRAFAADENTLSGKIKIDASEPDHNGNVKITVSVSESADMAAFRFGLDALTEYLQINNIVQGIDLTAGTFQYQCNADGVPVVLWYDSVSRSIDGEIFVIHATVKDGTKFGDYAIDLSWDADDICNEAFSNITLTADAAEVDYTPNLLISDAEMTVEGKDVSIQADFTSNARSSYSAIAILGFYENGRMVGTKIMPVEIHGDQADIAVTVDYEFTQCKLFVLESATTWIPIANATEVGS